MKKARVFLEWTPSVSLDVRTVSVLVTDVNGDEVLNTTVTPDVNKVEVGVFDQHAVLNAEVVTFDGIYESEPVRASFTVPDLEAPMGVTDLGFTYEVVESE